MAEFQIYIWITTFFLSASLTYLVYDKIQLILFILTTAIVQLIFYSLVFHLFYDDDIIIFSYWSLRSTVVFFISLLIAYFSATVANYLRRRLSVAPPYFVVNKRDLVPLDRRASLIVAVWFLTMTITCFFAIMKKISATFPSDEFYTAWVGDVSFFSVVGIAIAFAGVRLPELEKFDTRLSILFRGVDSAVKDSIKKRVKRLGFIVSELKRNVKVLDYSSDYEAYKVEIEVRHTLENVFGDEDAKDFMQFGAYPDKFEEKNMPPMLGQITAMWIEGEDDRRLKSPIEITYDGDNAFKCEIEVKKGTKPIVSCRYWLWVKIDEVWSHSPKRFCGEATTVVENIISGQKIDVNVENLVPITPSKEDGQYFRRKEDPENVINLKYNTRKNIHKYKNLDGGETKELMVFRKPTDALKASPPATTQAKKKNVGRAKAPKKTTQVSGSTRKRKVSKSEKNKK